MAARPDRQSDCSRCAALCCIAYPAEPSPGFAATKAAGEPCPKLDPCGQCTIYDSREQDGFSGCLRYECFGAGQHVVQHLFGGKDWRNDPALLAPMLESFLMVRKACDLLYLVDYARGRGVPPGQARELDTAERELVALTATRETHGKPAALERIERQLRELFGTLDRVAD